MSQSPPAQSPNAPPPLDPEAPIVADEHDDDEGVEAETDRSSSSSVTSSVFKYRFENGRRYHAYKDGAYAVPNDEPEMDRLNLQHYLCDLTFGGKLFLCPADPEKISRVLDAGTGTGAWAIDFADAHPNTELIGIDLSPIQPSFVPPNVQFFVDDLEDQWEYNYKFDLIYCRFLTGSIGDFPKLFKQAFDNMTPGGHIELVDVRFPLECDDDSLPKNSVLYVWSVLLKEGCAKLQRPLDEPERFPAQLQDAGFVNVAERTYKWPTNQWPADPHLKEVGAWEYENLGENLSGLSMGVFTRGLGWSQEQVEVFLVDVRKQMKSRKYHAYNPITVIYAQKPLGS